MPAAELTSFDAYEVFLSETLAGWPPARRVALAAAVAERWLPAYQAFAAAEDWGDPAALRRTLDAVWAHVRGRPLAPADAARHLGQLDELTPHMDDFDAEEALIACCVLADAVRACRGPGDALPFAQSALTGVFQGLVEEWPADAAGERRVWKRPAVRKEVRAQLELVEAVAAAALDDEGIRALRARAAGLAVKPPRRPEPKPPPGVTNQVMFEQYRRMVESDLRGRVRGDVAAAPGSYLFTVTYLGYWMGRYSRRMQSLNGSYGKLADEPGRLAVLARNRAADAADPGPAAWGSEADRAIGMCLENNSRLYVLDAPAADAPHAYGPSLRRLFRAGGWDGVRAWADDRPAAWDAEDRRKKKGAVHSAGHGDRLAREVDWAATGDPFRPWAAEVDGAAWRVRVNDFPDEVLYTLEVAGEPAGDFHDWPGTWRRPG